VDKKFKGKIINALRKLSFTYPPRNKVRKRQQIGPATFECEHCGIWIYEGSRDIASQLEILDLEPPVDLIKGKPNMDHLESVVPISGFKKGRWDWDEFINRMFCKESGFQLLCSSCHDIKTNLEDEMRKEHRQNKLTKKKK
jgi:hypothetical protein